MDSVGDGGPGVGIASGIGRQLTAVIPMADNLTFPSVETTINESHVCPVVQDLTETSLVVSWEIPVLMTLSSKSVMKCLSFKKVIGVFLRSWWTLTLLVESVDCSSTRRQLESVGSVLGFGTVSLRGSLRVVASSWSGNGDSTRCVNKGRERENSERPAQVHD